MEKKSSGKGLDSFLAGKGFYIVLLLCAVIIGISAWSLVSGETMKTAADSETQLEDSSSAVSDGDTDAAAPAINEEPSPSPIIEDPPETAQTGTWTQGDVWTASAEDYTAPVDGKAIRAYSVDKLAYDETMADWRTHDGIDVAAKDGTAVKAAHSGKVVSAGKDDMYGVTVVVDQGGGIKTAYSNLRDAPAVKAGDTISSGQIIGYVGKTALCETAEEPHVHISMSQNGKSVDPSQFIPG